MGMFVQPRPGGHHMPTTRHALRMTHQTSLVKVLTARAVSTRAIMMTTSKTKTQHGPFVIVRLLRVLR